MSTRLTKSLREAILTKAVAMAFGERKKQYELARSDFAYALYQMEFAGEKEQLARRLGNAWVRFDSHFDIESNCWDGSLHFPMCVRAERVGMEWPFPITMRHSAFQVELSHPMYPALEALEVERGKLREEEQEFRRNLTVLLNTVRSVEKLRELWPECGRVLPLGTETPKYEIAPVSLINDINRALGIPTAETPITKAMEK